MFIDSGLFIANIILWRLIYNALYLYFCIKTWEFLTCVIITSRSLM